MKTGQTVVGVLVLAVVVGGVFWARSRSAGPGAPIGAGAAASGAAAADDESLPDVTMAEGVAALGDVRLTLSVSPNPPAAFEKFRVRVSASGPAPAGVSPGGGAQWPLVLEGGQVTFEMTMPMGDHRYSLVPAGQAGYEAEVVLPLCKSGKRRWYATVEGKAAGRPVSARFRLDLAVPGTS
jgi:hypothetical protein